MWIKKNNASTTLAGDLLASGTSLVVKTGEGNLFPTTAEAPFKIKIEKYEGTTCIKREILTISWRSGDAMTISARASETCVQDDSQDPKTRTANALAFSSGDSVKQTLTEDDYNNLEEEVYTNIPDDIDLKLNKTGGTITGDLNVTGDIEIDGAGTNTANGLSKLDSNGKVPTANIPALNVDKFVYSYPCGEAISTEKVVEIYSDDYDNTETIIEEDILTDASVEKLGFMVGLIAGTYANIKLFLKKAGSPTDTLTVDVVEDNSGVPGSTVLQTYTLDLSTLTTSMVETTLTGSITVNETGKYWVVISRGTASATDYPILWLRDGFVTPTNKIYEGASWVDSVDFTALNETFSGNFNEWGTNSGWSQVTFVPQKNIVIEQCNVYSTVNATITLRQGTTVLDTANETTGSLRTFSGAVQLTAGVTYNLYASWNIRFDRFYTFPQNRVNLNLTWWTTSGGDTANMYSDIQSYESYAPTQDNVYLDSEMFITDMLSYSNATQTHEPLGFSSTAGAIYETIDVYSKGLLALTTIPGNIYDDIYLSDVDGEISSTAGTNTIKVWNKAAETTLKSNI